MYYSADSPNNSVYEVTYEIAVFMYGMHFW